MVCMLNPTLNILFVIAVTASARAEPSDVTAFLDANCTACHNAESKAGKLDLGGLGRNLDEPAILRKWITIHERVAAGEMRPKKADQPTAADRDAFIRHTAKEITDAEDKRVVAEGRATRRRMNRQEYEYA